MTNRKAILVLENHREILAHDKDDKCFVWQQQGLSYLERMFGKESKEYVILNSFSFPNVQETKYDERLKLLKHLMLERIARCIDTIRNIGIKREYHNFLCKYSDKELIAGGIAVATAIFGAGMAIQHYLFACPNI